MKTASTSEGGLAGLESVERLEHVVTELDKVCA